MSGNGTAGPDGVKIPYFLGEITAVSCSSVALVLGVLGAWTLSVKPFALSNPSAQVQLWQCGACLAALVIGALSIVVSWKNFTGANQLCSDIVTGQIVFCTFFTRTSSSAPKEQKRRTDI